MRVLKIFLFLGLFTPTIFGDFLLSRYLSHGASGWLHKLGAVPLFIMGREQELIQAVKNEDVPGVQKLVAKIKVSKSSEYLLIP